MDISTINILAEMGTNLTTLALKGTATAIHSKIESVKNEKNTETLRNTYDEIISQLLSEREEAIRIAQAYKEELEIRNQVCVPIGKLDDIEIIFLHYHSENEAREKWDRRKKRVNYEDIFLKFSMMNLCTEIDLKNFDKLPMKNKIMLTNRPLPQYSCAICWKGKADDNSILNDTNSFPGNIPLVKFFNHKAETYYNNITTKSLF